MKQLISLKQFLFMVLVLSSCICCPGCRKEYIEAPTQDMVTNNLKPNLWAKKIDKNTVDSPRVPTVDCTWIVTFDAINDGNKNAGAFTIAIIPSSPNEAAMNIYVGNLNLASSRRFQFVPTIKPMQSDKLTVIVDSKNSVAETCETDNKFELIWDEEKHLWWLNPNI